MFVIAIGDAHSNDVGHWEGALVAQDASRNPYETGVLNWPPFWLQIIVAIDYAAGALGFSFFSVLRIYLVLVESALVIALYFVLVRSGRRARPRQACAPRRHRAESRCSHPRLPAREQ